MGMRVWVSLIAVTFLFSGAQAQVPDLVASDFDGSGRVDFADFLEFAAAFGKSAGDDGFDAKFDLDGGGSVDFQDFLRFAANFGKSTTPSVGTFLYIADIFANRVEVVDTESNLTIPSRAFSVTFPRGLTLGSQTGLVYVATNDSLFAYTDQGSRSFFIELTPIVDPVNENFVAPGGFKVVVNGDESRAYVSEDVAGRIEILDLSNRVSLGTVDVGEVPTGMVLSSDESELYVGRRGTSIAVVDPAALTVVDSIVTGSLATSRLAASPDRSRLYAVTSESDDTHQSGLAINLLELDPAARSIANTVRISRPADLSTQPVDLSVTPDGATVSLSVNRTDPGDNPDFSTLVQVGTLVRVNANTFTISDEISVLQLMFGFGVSPDGATGYFSGIQDLTDPTFRVFVIDMGAGTLLSQLPVSLDSGAEFLFVSAKQALSDLLAAVELALFSP